MLETFINILLDFSANFGYLGVLILMTVESSFIPFPSELIIPPAAFLAQQGEFNIFLVIFFGILGSIIGALINYYLAKFLGRPVAYKLINKGWARFFLLNELKLRKAEKYFLKYGNMSTFIGRLIPGIRQLISLPAGFSQMKLTSFIFFTTLGAGIWVVILALQGYLIGVYKEFFITYLTWILIGLVAFSVVIYLFVRWWKKTF